MYDFKYIGYELRVHIVVRLAAHIRQDNVA